MMINEGLYFKCRLPDLSFVPAYFQSLKFLVDAYNRVSEITMWKQINDSPFFENSGFLEPTEYFNYDTKTICDLLDKIANHPYTYI